MIDPTKGCTDINLRDPNLLPTLQFTLQSMGHAQQYFTGTQNVPMTKLGGW